jgi:hypothetical protein
MTTADRQSHWLDGLARRVGLDTDAAHVADTIVSTVRDIETVLRPVIGPTGFDALYSRCVYLAGLDHPWLTDAREPLQTPVDLGALLPVLARQTSADAAAGGVALLQTFNDLLATLIGRALSLHLLGSVGQSPLTLCGAAAQDTLQ